MEREEFQARLRDMYRDVMVSEDPELVRKIRKGYEPK